MKRISIFLWVLLFSVAGYSVGFAQQNSANDEEMALLSASTHLPCDRLAYQKEVFKQQLLAYLATGDCTHEGIKLYGKVQVVNSFPDLKVQVVNSFPDLKVQVVNSFPDSCGEWQMVNSFPDFKIQFVNSFPDIKIQYVNSFPGEN